MRDNLRQLGEFGTIEHLKKRLAVRDGVRVGIGDDAAVLDALSQPVVTCDCLIEGVHFRRDWMTPRQLGRKALAVNLSDIAAMRARPVAAFVALALSPHDDLEFVEELYDGMETIAREYNFSICGGDTSRSSHGLMLSITLIGDLVGDANAPLLRSGARDGDAVLVTGTLGDSAAGLSLLQNPDFAQRIGENAAQFLLERHFNPTPRLREIAAIPNGFLHAALDLSDGLAGDARHIARASGVDVVVETSRLPISPNCLQAAQLLEHRVLDWAIGGGEDYELLLCVAPEKSAEVIEIVRLATGTRATQIGFCERTQNEPRVVMRNADGSEENFQSWTHF